MEIGGGRTDLLMVLTWFDENFKQPIRMKTEKMLRKVSR